MMSAQVMADFAFTEEQRRVLGSTLNDNGIEILRAAVEAFQTAQEPAAPFAPTTDRSAQRLQNLTDAVRHIPGVTVSHTRLPLASRPAASTPRQLYDQLLETADVIEQAIAAVRALPPHDAFDPSVGYQLTQFTWTLPTTSAPASNDRPADLPPQAVWPPRVRTEPPSTTFALRRGGVGQWLEDGVELVRQLRSGASDLDVSGRNYDVRALNIGIGLAVFVSSGELRHGAIMRVLKVLRTIPGVNRSPENALVKQIREAVEDVPLGPGLCGELPIGTRLGVADRLRRDRKSAKAPKPIP